MFVLGSLAGGGAERIVSHLVKHSNRDEFDARVGLLWRHGPYLREFAETDLVVPAWRTAGFPTAISRPGGGSCPRSCSFRCSSAKSSGAFGRTSSSRRPSR